jgi:hypothetical protein
MIKFSVYITFKSIDLSIDCDWTHSVNVFFLIFQIAIMNTMNVSTGFRFSPFSSLHVEFLSYKHVGNG